MRYLDNNLEEQNVNRNEGGKTCAKGIADRNKDSIRSWTGGLSFYSTAKLLTVFDRWPDDLSID